MQKLLEATLIVSCLALPLSARAASGDLLTELDRLESAGYNPASDDPTYPANMQRAQDRVQAIASKSARVHASAVGGTVTFSEEQGRRADASR